MIIVTVVAVAFITGAVAGVIALVRAGIAREEADCSLRDGPTTLASAATRRMLGLSVRVPPGTHVGDPARPPYARDTRSFPAGPCR